MNKTPQFQIIGNFFQRFSNCHVQTDGRTGTQAGANMHICFFLILFLKRAKNPFSSKWNFSYFVIWFVPVRIIGTRNNETLSRQTHSIFLWRNIKTCTYWNMRTGYFFRRSTDHKHRVNKKQNLCYCFIIYYIHIINKTLKLTVLPHAEAKRNTWC